MKRWTAFLFLAVLLMAACSPQPAARVGSIEIVSPWVRPAAAMGGATGAAYLTIRNTGKEADRLVKVETTAAGLCEIHQTKMDGDVMSMSPAESIEVPANGSVDVKPGGYHIMMLNLKEDLKSGSKIPFTLTFDKAGTVEVEGEVKEQ